MAKFRGTIGYVGEGKEVGGVWKEEMIEFPCIAEDATRSVTQTSTETVNPELSSGNSVSIVADAYARAHYFAIRYIILEGVPWRVAEATVRYPRLVLRLGGVYSGPTAPAPSNP